MTIQAKATVFKAEDKALPSVNTKYSVFEFLVLNWNYLATEAHVAIIFSHITLHRKLVQVQFREYEYDLLMKSSLRNQLSWGKIIANHHK